MNLAAHYAIMLGSVVILTTSEQISHVDVLLGLLGLLFLGRLSSGTSGTGGSGGGGSGADVGEELGDVLTLEGLGEKAGPVAFNGVAGGLDHLVQFLLLSARNENGLAGLDERLGDHCQTTYRDLELSVVEEQSSVGANELILLGSRKSGDSDLSHC